jgi:hypothetical protein
MSRYYRRTTPGPRENLGAGLVAAGLAAGVAAASFYLVRLFLAREPLDPASSAGPPSDSGTRATAGSPDPAPRAVRRSAPE